MYSYNEIFYNVKLILISMVFILIGGYFYKKYDDIKEENNSNKYDLILGPLFFSLGIAFSGKGGSILLNALINKMPSSVNTLIK